MKGVETSIHLSTHTGVETVYLAVDDGQEVFGLDAIPGSGGQVVMVIEIRNQLQTVSDENQLRLHLEREKSEF